MSNVQVWTEMITFREKWREDHGLRRMMSTWGSFLAKEEKEVTIPMWIFLFG